MEQPTRNKGFVAKGAGIVMLVAAIIIVVWFIVTRADHPVTPKAGNGSDSTGDTASTKVIPADSLQH